VPFTVSNSFNRPFPEPNQIAARELTGGEKGAILGAAILGTAAALIGSQLCEESCTGTTIGFGLVGATVGAVVGAFLGGGGDDGD
jgi:hypothetical protein